MKIGFTDEIALIKALKRGNGLAFETLIGIYGNRLLRVCYLVLKDMHSAEDLVQETYVQVFKNIKKFKAVSSLYTWIYTIAINKCRDELKRKNDTVLLDEIAEMDSDSDVEAEAESNIRADRIKEIVFSLPAIYREVVSLYYYEDMPVKQISDILVESEGTVKSKLNRARNLIKNKLLGEVSDGYGQI